jgi:cytidine deaminase
MDLPQETIDRLIEAATAVRDRAYAPYSEFAVGSALLGADGRIFVGCNVENASFGLTICAERNAIASAVAQGVHEFEALVIITDTSPPASPCGACRQVLTEFGDFPVLLVNPAGEARSSSIAELQPRPFRSDSLRKD